uniref:DDE Tnp4 domain-containing protein n=1 Tax=Gouania willdenowi TaxID=441366 RepID=A0A8C5EAH0_GOUWI
MSAFRFDDLLLAVTLCVLASGNNQQSVAQSYMMGPTTVSFTVTEVCEAIWGALCSEFLALPNTAKWSEFWRVWNFPNCLGCIDGKHVVMKAPQGVTISTPKEHIPLLHGNLDIPPPANLPGTAVPVPHVFLADAAFLLQQNIMRPFPGVLYIGDHVKNLFVFIFSILFLSILRMIENSFNILAKTVKVVKASVALHNYLSTGHNNLLDIGRLGKARASWAALSAQNDFKSLFLTPQGLVPWQENAIRKGTLNRIEDNTGLQ